MSDAIEFFFFSLLRRITRYLSFRSAGKVGAFLGNAVFSLTTFRKAVTLDNLRHAFPEKSEAEIAAIARGAFKNYGIALVESLWAGHQSAEVLASTVRVTNPEVLAQARSHQKGVLLLTGHYGSWELLMTGARLNLGTPFGIIFQRQRNKRIDATLEALRSRFGNFTIPVGGSSWKVVNALAENVVVLLAADQSGPKEAVYVDFFGRPAATHRGVAALSLRTGAPIVTGFLVRQQDGTYTMTLEEVDRSGLDSSSDEDNIIELTKRHTAVLERWIRKHPDHWLWMHKRWKHTEYFTHRKHMEERE